jgi:hypothetical protein
MIPIDTTPTKMNVPMVRAPREADRLHRLVGELIAVTIDDACDLVG